MESKAIVDIPRVHFRKAMGSDEGSAPNMRQTITWTNDDLVIDSYMPYKMLVD